VQSHTVFLDSHWGVGASVRELVHGVDCPLTAAYMDVVTWYKGMGAPVTHKNAICVFETDQNVAALRHYDYAFKYYGAVKSHALTVRMVSEVRFWFSVFGGPGRRAAAVCLLWPARGAEGGARGGAAAAGGATAMMPCCVKALYVAKLPTFRDYLQSKMCLTGQQLLTNRHRPPARSTTMTTSAISTFTSMAPWSRACRRLGESPSLIGGRRHQQLMPRLKQSLPGGCKQGLTTLPSTPFAFLSLSSPSLTPLHPLAPPPQTATSRPPAALPPRGATSLPTP
jgi:hypothetical protein